MQWKTREFRQKAAIGFGILLLLLFITNLGVYLAALPFFALYWVYVICCLLLLEWLVAWRRRGEPPVLPIGPERWRGAAKTRQVMLAYVIIFTLLREGALAPDFILNVNIWSSNSQQSFNTNALTNTQSNGGEARFAGRFTSCDITCSGDSVLCQGLKTRLYCDDQSDPQSTRTDRLYISGSVSFSGAPFCYTPLYKTGSTNYTATLFLNANQPDASKSGSFSISGSISKDMWGVASCYGFTQLMGQSVGGQITQALNKFIVSN